MRIFTKFRQDISAPDSHRWQGDAKISEPPIAGEPVRIQTTDHRASIYLSRGEALEVGKLVGLRPFAEHKGLKRLMQGNGLLDHPDRRTVRVLPSQPTSGTVEALRVHVAILQRRLLLMERQEDPQWGSEA